MPSTAIYSTTLLAVITGSAYSASFFQNVPNVTSIQGPAFEKEIIDVTNMSSTGYKEYMTSYLADAGELTATTQWKPTDAVHKKLLAFAVTSSNQVNPYRVTFSDGTNYEFSGSVAGVSFKADSPGSSVLEAEVKIRLVGSVTLPA
jgi:hypothetical protein